MAFPAVLAETPAMLADAGTAQGWHLIHRIPDGPAGANSEGAVAIGLVEIVSVWSLEIQPSPMLCEPVFGTLGLQGPKMVMMDLWSCLLLVIVPATWEKEVDIAQGSDIDNPEAKALSVVDYRYILDST